MTNKSGMRLLIKEASKAFRKKRFLEAIALLEKTISYSPGDIYPYFLLCVSYLLLNRFSEADNMIKKCRSIDPNYKPLNQLEAFLNLKSAPDIHSVVKVYIDKLNRYPDDKYFKIALRNLRKEKKFDYFQKNAKLKDFVIVPKLPKYFKNFITSDFKSFPEKQQIKYNKKRETPIRRFNWGKLIVIILTVCLLGSAGGLLYYLFNTGTISFYHEEKSPMPVPVDTIDIALLQYDLIDKILKTKPLVFYYSNDEVISDFNKAKSLIKSEKYNDALIIINKIGNSNANYRVKEKTEFLRKFIAGVEYKSYRSIPIEQVFQKPYLYMGSFVKWKGKIANLRRKDKSFTFNLLIDYKKDDIFRGIIDVYCGKEYKEINNGDIVSLEGVLVNTIGTGNRLYISADNILK